MTPFVPGGPVRYRHQKRALRKMIATGGVTALLMEPGLGKTASALDFASLLALKSTTGEARVLVVCPLAAVDTWVVQAATYVSPQVHYWAEAVGGSIHQRAQVLSARGGQPRSDVKPVRGHRTAPRAWGVHRAWAWGARASTGRRRPLTPSEGPDGLGTDKPRLIIEVLNIDTFSSRQVVGTGRQTMADIVLDGVQRFSPDLVIVDESHKIKSNGGYASRLLARIGRRVKRRLILTGTVMPHSPMDVFGQWRFLDPDAFGIKQLDGTIKSVSYGAFESRFAIKGGYMGYEVIGFKNLDVMQDIMARNSIVVTKAEALDLPPTSDVVVPVHLTPAEERAYRQMRDDLATDLGTQVASSGNRLTQMLRLRQITSGHLPDDQGNTMALGASKVDTITSLVHDTLIGEQRVVIFCVFSQEIADLAAALRAKEPKSAVEVIEGATTPDRRLAIRQRFGDLTGHPERMILVAQIKTLSLAVNELVTASHAIFGSMSQQRDDLVQARDRLNRIGQTKPMTFWFALAPHTVDEVIYASHRDKSDLEQAMLNHIKGEE